MMMANALTSAFGGKHGNADAAAGEKASLADTNPAEEVADDASITNSLYDNPAEDQDDSFDDFGGDGGDEGDWA